VAARGGEQGRTADPRIGRTRWRGDGVKVATFRDITARRGAEARLRDFVSVASHELRTPATSIAGSATTLMDHYVALSEDERRRSLAAIHRQSKRLVALATGLLELARLEQGSMQTFPSVVSLGDCVATAIEAAVVDVAEVAGGDGVEVFVDDEHLQVMLVNLLTNADKYGQEPISVRGRIVDDRVEVVVRDEGEGVPAEFRGRLFERFARASTGVARRVPGTGLGLALVAALAQLNGGETWHRPNEPRGSQFGVSLPRRDPAT